MNTRPLQCLLRPILLGALTLLVGGCFVAVGRERSEPPLDRGLIEKIRPRTTTAAEILQWFGPPAMIARQSSAQHASAADTAPLLELFAAKRPLGDQHVVYFYHSAARREVAGGVLLAAGVHSRAVVDRLWILIDKQSGLVDDYVFRAKE